MLATNYQHLQPLYFISLAFWYLRKLGSTTLIGEEQKLKMLAYNFTMGLDFTLCAPLADNVCAD